MCVSLKLAAKNIPLICSLYSYNEQICSATNLIPALCAKYYVQSAKWSHWVNIRAESARARMSFCFGPLGLRVNSASKSFYAKDLWSFLDLFGFSGADLQSAVLHHQFLMQFKERHAIAIVHLSSKNDTWKKVDCVEIRESSRGGFILCLMRRLW